MRETNWHIAIIIVVTGFVFFTNLGEARLWDRDEPRNAGCAAEMMERGEWVVPIFNDELRHQKPVLLYWLIMSAYGVFGVNEFSARFWSATLAVGTTLATYGIARRLTNSKVALLAAIALATSVMFDVAARAATPDSVLIFCGTTAMLAYVLGTFRQTDTGLELKEPDAWFPSQWPYIIGMYMMLGLGVLAKGPVGFLLPMAMIGLFMLIMRSPEHGNEASGAAKSGSRPANFSRNGWRNLKLTLAWFHPVHFSKTLWSMRPLTGALIVLVIAVPWYVLVGLKTDGDFTQMFFVGEHFNRTTQSMENHNGGLWFYPAAILIGFFPWSVFWAPVVAGLFSRKGRFASDSCVSDSSRCVVTTLMVCWIGIQVVAFSIVKTKLPSYVTPCYPALAILTAVCLHSILDRQNVISKRWLYAAFGGLVFGGLATSVGLGFATVKFLPLQLWLAGLGVSPLVGGIVLMWLVYTDRLRQVPAVLSITAVLFSIGLFGFGTTSIDSEQQSDQILAKLRPGVAVGAFGALESSWVFYAGCPIVELTPGGTETKLGIETRTKFWKPKPTTSVESFVAVNPDAMLITTDEFLEDVKARIPQDYEVIQTASYFLKNSELILLGRPEQGAVGAEESMTFTVSQSSEAH